jgi:tetratricopeptide (TPR) repeat protein/outer membrane protein OmpA-like peptidoglycan-associated protein
MKIITVLLISCFMNCLCCLAQADGKMVITANDYFSIGNYSAALPMYKYLLHTDSLNTDLNFKIGVCYLYSRSQKNKSVYYLKKAVILSELNEKNILSIPITVYKFLGDASYSLCEFNQAITYYEKFRKVNTDTSQAQRDRLENYIALCRIGKKSDCLNNTSIQPATTNFANSYNPLKNDSITTVVNNIIKAPSTDKEMVNEVAIGTSEDKQSVLIYRVNKGEGNLYVSYLNNNEWTISDKLMKAVNTAGWESGECISADGNTLYFSSERSDGYGGKDIYKSIKLPDGKWSREVNLGPMINTPYDEEAPFIYPDGTTLYFSSNGHKTIGLFDIYTSTLSDDSIWSSPINIGYPADTKYKQSPKSSKKNNYAITFFNATKAPITLLDTKITAPLGRSLQNVKIIVTDNETGEISATYYSTNKNEGECLFILPSGKNSNITYEAKEYLFQSENCDLSKVSDYYKELHPIQLFPFAVKSTVILNNIFFDPTQSTLLPSSTVELDRLFYLLKTHPDISVSIYSCINSKGRVNYNSAKENAKAVLVSDYLIKKGLNPQNITPKKYKKIKATKAEEGSIVGVHKNQKNFWLELKIYKVNKQYNSVAKR